jgi:PhzF family phenazine biosynthesis protein
MEYKMKVKVKVLNAFIDNNQGGNPAGVVMDADKLNHQQKLSIAKQIGLSETAFVSKSSIADYKLDFYTPNRQIAHCGHATIAVFSYLAENQNLSQGWYTKETIDGTRKILIENNSAYMEQLAPKYTEIESYQNRVVKSLNLNQTQILEKPLLVNTGNSFVIIGVKDQQTLAQLNIDFDSIKTISEQLDLIGYYVYTLETHNLKNDASTRMFFPRYGVDEEAATGMAAGPMACYLYDKVGIKKSKFIIEQGFFMPQPSASKIQVDLKLEKDQITSLMAGGKAKLTKQIVIEI